MIIAALRIKMLESAEVSALIASRLYPTVLPQGAALPAADMRTIANDSVQHLDGGVRMYRHEAVFDCYGDESETADAVAYAMIGSGVIGFKGDVPIPGTTKTVHIRGVTLDDGVTQDFEGVEPGSERIRYVSTFSLDVSWAVSSS